MNTVHTSSEDYVIPRTSLWLQPLQLNDDVTLPVDDDAGHATSSADSQNYGDLIEQSRGWKVARQLEPVMKDVMESYLYNVPYQADRCSRLSKDISEVIKDKAKLVLGEQDKYRIVSQVVLGQDNIDQTIQLATRCLCNQAVDSCATATYRNRSIYAMSIVCAFYSSPADDL